MAPSLTFARIRNASWGLAACGILFSLGFAALEYPRFFFEAIWRDALPYVIVAVAAWWSATRMVAALAFLAAAAIVGLAVYAYIDLMRFTGINDIQNFTDSLRYTLAISAIVATIIGAMFAGGPSASKNH